MTPNVKVQTADILIENEMNNVIFGAHSVNSRVPGTNRGSFSYEVLHEVDSRTARVRVAVGVCNA